jgi:hypothetical protein
MLLYNLTTKIGEISESYDSLFTNSFPEFAIISFPITEIFPEFADVG